MEFEHALFSGDIPKVLLTLYNAHTETCIRFSHSGSTYNPFHALVAEWSRLAGNRHDHTKPGVHADAFFRAKLREQNLSYYT